MSSLDIYCAACGAANTADKTICFACGHDLSEVEPDEVLLHERYRVLAVVGQGGFARVYRAEDTLEGRIVAIKAIHLKALSAQEMIDATDTYNRELRFGALLNHPALPKIYDSFTDQHNWYIVAEFIDGQTLEEYMQRLPGQRVHVHEVIALGAEVCEALAYLHSQQPPVIFRDIKPDNIMRTSTGRIYLIDFGIARQLRPRSKRDTQVLGSPGYAAPEQYGKAQTNERSDIYSLGATLRALLTGKNPLDAQDEDLEQLKTTSPGLAALLTQMLALDPARRPASAEAVKQQLRSIGRGRDVSLLYTANKVAPPVPNALKLVARKKAHPIWQRMVVAVGILCTLGSLVGNPSFFSSVQHIFQAGDGSIGTTHTLPARAARQTLALGIGSGKIQLDPTQVMDTQTTRMEEALYGGLVQLDDTTHVQPQLAASWQESQDGRAWTFHLRPNLKFSDGSPLTSQDVAFSLDRALDPAQGSPLASTYLGDLQNADLRLSGRVPTLIGTSILMLDPTTIMLKTSGSIAFLPAMLTAPCALILEKSLVMRYGARFVDHLSEGGASGPFKFARRTSSNTIDLVPNPYYYGPKPQLTTLSFAFFDSSASSYKAYLADQVAMTEIPSSRLGEVNNADDFHAASQLWVTYYAMNYLVKPFDNLHIRQAFALALDKQLIADVVQKKSVVATNHIIPAGEDGFNPKLVGPRGVTSLHDDPVSAQQLLRTGLVEEGLVSSDQLPPITFSYENTPQARDEATMAQEMWQNVLGIKVHLQPLSISELLNREQASANNPHGLQLWRLSWSADYPDPQDWTTLQFGLNAPDNTVNYAQNNSASAAKQREVQQMLQEADRQADHARRIQLYQYAEQSLVNDVARIPLYQAQDNYLLKPGVNGYTINAMGTIPADDWSHIYITE